MSTDTTTHDIQWIAIGHIDDIPRRGARCVSTPRGRIAVFRAADDTVFALDDRCPHKSGPLAQGIVHGHSVTCPLHNWVIALDTGAAQGADEGQVRTWAVRNTAGSLFLSLDGPFRALDLAAE
ncbi:nitrite reductase small subunit NirD [Xanthobacter sp. V4C-4]|uniref:nitrite reductase small subunit NirD n=1 Tax=Xanthobacter cornucopiae TaxID=3119924 RepID=UPI003726D068